MVFDTPSLLPVAPVVALVAVLLSLWARRARIQRAQRWSSELGAQARRVGRFGPLGLSLATFLATVALAGPRWGHRVVTAETKALDLVIAIDVSRSMLAEDVPPSRLGRTQREASRLVHDLAGDRIGLIAFSGQSYILSPLTVDGPALQLRIDALHPDMMSAGGTGLGRALRQGHDLLLGGSAVADRVLVVFTDGEAHDSLSDVLNAAERLRRDGVRLILVGEGGNRPTPIPLRDAQGNFIEYQPLPEGGLVQTVRRDDILTATQDAAHGAQVAAALADQAGAVRELVAGYKRSPQATTSASDRPPRGWIPLLGAVILLVAHGFTRRTAALAGLAVWLAGAPRLAAQGAGNAADSAWVRGDFRVAAVRYLRQMQAGEGGDTTWYNAGTAALAVGDTALARRALVRATRSLDPDVRFRALYNLGLLSLRLAATDARSRDHYLEEARQRYREALLLRPGDTAAQWNLELAIRQQQGGGGGEDAPPPPGASGAPPSTPRTEQRGGLTLAQAQQILNSIAEEERATRRKLPRRGLGREAAGGRNW